jgi:adenylate kinase family enzyme
VRYGGSDQAQANGAMIVSALCEQGYFSLNVNDLCRDEIDRRTPIGIEIENLNAAGLLVPNELYVRMLRQIIFNGDCEYDKFQLYGFPETTEALYEFESKCARITAIIYASSPGPVVEIMHDNLNSFNIDSLFAKQNRLKTMKNWDARELEEQLGNRTEWGMVSGRSLSGKTTVAKMIAAVNRGKIINMTEIAEECKKKLGTEEEPFEGEVPLAEVQKGICTLVNADKAHGENFLYIFDGYMHKSADEFLRWFSGEFGAPTFQLNLTCDKGIIMERFKEKNGIGEGDELNEDQTAELVQQAKAADAEKKQIDACLKDIGGKTKIIDGFSTDTSEESTKERLRSEFCAKIILINHDPKLEVDVACSNLAIKFNMLYLSVFQLIKEQIEKCTPIGKALAKSRQPRVLKGEPVESKDGLSRDEFEFSAAHYDLPIVMQLIKQTIQERRTTQQFILLEGLCNVNRLRHQQDRLQMRQMDELFALEKNIAEVNSVISLLFGFEPTTIPESDIRYEKFEAPKVEEKKVEKKDGDDDEDAPADEPPADDGEPVKKVFNPAEF